MLEVGTKAPDFTLPDQNGEMHSLSDYRGEKVVLYFYPKDMTAGCTKQACAFGELYPQFHEKGAVVLGVSKDSSPLTKNLKRNMAFRLRSYRIPIRKLSRLMMCGKRRKTTAKCLWALCGQHT